MDPSMEEHGISTLDAIVIGAGFGGLHALHQLRELGLLVKCFEKGANLGGVWHWNRYPGARVDSEYIIYQYSNPEIWGGWTWKERFPDWKELRAYFAFVDRKLELSKDIYFNTAVTGACFDEVTHTWLATLSTGLTVRARWLVPAMGFAAKPYIPHFPGLARYQGQTTHTALWPQKGIDLRGKRVAVIGTGSTAVQLIQEIGPQVKSLAVYQRTPNLSLPMRQTKLNKYSEDMLKADGTYSRVFQSLPLHTCGFQFQFVDQNLEDVPEEVYLSTFEDLWGSGGLRFWLANYKDISTNKNSNDKAYAFWAEKTRARISNPRSKDILAPLLAPYSFGAKRPSLEQSYFEVFNQANVQLIDVSEDPIQEFTEFGIRTENTLVDVDVVIFATGFDAMTGGFTQLNLQGTDGRTMKDHWADGVHSYLGLSYSCFPNMLTIYGPQAPSSSSNGPTIMELQSTYISRIIAEMNRLSVTRMEAKITAEAAWKTRINEEWHKTVFTEGTSWYQGANIPGKKIEALNWAGGLPVYMDLLDAEKEQGYPGFRIDSLHTQAQDIQAEPLGAARL